MTKLLECGTSNKYCAGCRCAECRAAANKHNKEWARKNPDKVIAYRKITNARRKAKGIEHQRNHWLGWRYGITVDMWNQMWQQQKGCCKICLRKFDKSIRVLKPHVDHDHVTGKVRALLCTQCNILVGACDERIDILQQAIAYVSTEGSAEPPNGFIPRTEPVIVTPELEAEICRVRQDYSILELTQKFRLSAETMQRILRKHGIKKLPGKYDGS